MKTPLLIELLNVTPEACVIGRCGSQNVVQYVLAYDKAPLGAFDADSGTVVPIEPIPRKLMRLCQTHRLTPAQMHPLVREISRVELAALQAQGGYLFIDARNAKALPDRTPDEWFKICQAAGRAPVFIIQIEAGYHIKWRSASQNRGVTEATRKVVGDMYQKLGEQAPWKSTPQRGHQNMTIDEKTQMFSTPVIPKFEDAVAFMSAIHDVESVIRDDDLFEVYKVMES